MLLAVLFYEHPCFVAILLLQTFIVFRLLCTHPSAIVDDNNTRIPIAVAIYHTVIDASHSERAAGSLPGLILPGCHTLLSSLIYLIDSARRLLWLSVERSHSLAVWV